MSVQASKHFAISETDVHKEPRISENLAPVQAKAQVVSEKRIEEFGIFLIYFAPTPGSSGLAEGASMLMMGGAMPAAFVPYYNLLWRSSTLYLPAIAGLVFLSWAIIQNARRVVHR